MKCPKCSHEVPLSDDFCRYCGTARPRQVCPCCQAEHDPEPIFCPKTGKNIAETRKRIQKMTELVSEIRKGKKRQARWRISLVSVTIIAVALSLLAVAWVASSWKYPDFVGMGKRIVDLVLISLFFGFILTIGSGSAWSSILDRQSRREAERRIKGL